MRRPEEKVWVQVCLLDKYVATSSMIKTPRVPYGSREEIGGLAEKVAEDNSDLFFSLLSTLKNFNSIAIQSKCHCGIHAKSIFITVQKDFFYGFCMEIVRSGAFDGIHMLKEVT